MTYGCYNREPFLHHTKVQSGVSEEGAVEFVHVPFRMDPLCQYTHTELGQKDAGCVGCKWRTEHVNTETNS